MKGFGLRFLLSIFTPPVSEELVALSVRRVRIRRAPCRSKACRAGRRVTPTKPPYQGTGPPTLHHSARSVALFSFFVKPLIMINLAHG